MLVAAGFAEIKIQIKDNAADIIKDWMPGSGAEKYITSAYVTATKPKGRPGMRDDVHRDVAVAEVVAATELAGGASGGAADAGC